MMTMTVVMVMMKMVMMICLHSQSLGILPEVTQWVLCSLGLNVTSLKTLSKLGCRV